MEAVVDAAAPGGATRGGQEAGCGAELLSGPAGADSKQAVVVATSTVTFSVCVPAPEPEAVPASVDGNV